jgi:hypothetical protein
MPQSDIGVGALPLPQFDYPFNIGSAPIGLGTNRISLGPGQVWPVPRGTYLLAVTGVISAFQWFDPVRQEWVNLLGPGAAWQVRMEFIDGSNYRVVNLSDSWYGGLVTTPGTGYAQASTSVTAGTGNSTWQPIVGGALGTFTTNAGTGFNAGSGWTKPPIVAIANPPPPGIAATATAALNAGAVGTVTIRTAGAGYTTAPPVYLFPDITDPAYISGAAQLWSPNPGLVTVALTGAGTVTGLLLVNAGQLLTTAPTLTVNGVGSSAVVTTNPASVVAAANDVLTIMPC